MDVTIFYAWQSDSNDNHNHYLIRDAAKEACARITADPKNDWNVTLDHDTKGVPGMCDIPKEILAKIRKCDIFLADLTLVGKTEGGKMLPNSNVVVELGSAAKCIGFKALIGVVNEASGKVEGQVFDIKRRACVKYTTQGAAKRAELEKITERLSAKLEEIIRGTIETVVLKKYGALAAGDQATAQEEQKKFALKVTRGEFYDLTERSAVLTSFFFASPDVEHDRVGEAIREQFQANPIVDSSSYAWKTSGSVNEFSWSGHLHRGCSRDYKSMLQRRSFHGLGEDAKVLSAEPLQGNILRGVLNLSKFLISLKVKTPWDIGITLVGVKGYQLLNQRDEPGPRRLSMDIFCLPVQRVSALAQVTDVAAVGTLLRPALEMITRSVGWEFNWCYTENGLLNLRIMDQIP